MYKTSVHLHFERETTCSLTLECEAFMTLSSLATVLGNKKKEPISPISRERSYTQKESQIGGSSRWP